MPENKEGRSYLLSVLGCRCPRCREGKLFQYPTYRFKKFMIMYKNCPVCGQPTEIEVGFYYGTGYVSYALTVVICLVSLALWWLTIGLSINDNRLFAWIAFNALLLLALQPWLMRVSRSIWISWFVKYDPDWKTHGLDKFERIIPDQMEIK